MRRLVPFVLLMCLCGTSVFAQLTERFTVSLRLLNVLGISWVYRTIAIEMNGRQGTEYIVQVWTGEDSATGRTGWRIIVPIATAPGVCDAGEITLPEYISRVHFVDTNGDGRVEYTQFFPENQLLQSQDFDLSACEP